MLFIKIYNKESEHFLQFVVKPGLLNMFYDLF